MTEPIFEYDDEDHPVIDGECTHMSGHKPTMEDASKFTAAIITFILAFVVICLVTVLGYKLVEWAASI